MRRATTCTTTCTRNGGGDACPIFYAVGPQARPFYTGGTNSCKACNQIYYVLVKLKIYARQDVGNVSRPVFNRGVARVRAREYQPHPPSDKSSFYLVLVKEVVRFALNTEDDASFEAEVRDILERIAGPLVAAQDDEEAEVEELAVGNVAVEDQEYEDQDAEDELATDQEAVDQEAVEQEAADQEAVDQEAVDQEAVALVVNELEAAQNQIVQGHEIQEQDGAQGSEGSAHACRQALLKRISSIADRQAHYAALMLELTAELSRLSVDRQ
ncbi:unnamed protein product [Mortierella alpina]